MPVYIHVIKDGKVILSDRLSSIYFKKHYYEFLEYVKMKFSKNYPNLMKVFKEDSPIDPDKLLSEAMDFFIFLLNQFKDKLPLAYFFAVFPKDYLDLPSLLLGGTANLKLTTDDGIYEFQGGFGYAKLFKNGKFVRNLTEGEEIKVGTREVKVFSRRCYELIEHPIKTLIAISLIALKHNAKIVVKSTDYTSVILESFNIDEFR